MPYTETYKFRDGQRFLDRLSDGAFTRVKFPNLNDCAALVYRSGADFFVADATAQGEQINPLVSEAETLEQTRCMVGNWRDKTLAVLQRHRLPYRRQAIVQGLAFANLYGAALGWKRHGLIELPAWYNVFRATELHYEFGPLETCSLRAAFNGAPEASKTSRPNVCAAREDMMFYVAFAALTELQRLHAMGIGHYDIKPDNILVEHNLQQIYLSDFENAQWLSALDGTPLRVVVPGQEAYRYPGVEDEDASPRHDLYSFAVSMLSLWMNEPGLNSVARAELAAALNSRLRDEQIVGFFETDRFGCFPKPLVRLALACIDPSVDFTLQDFADSYRARIEDGRRCLFSSVKESDSRLESKMRLQLMLKHLNAETGDV